MNRQTAAVVVRPSPVAANGTIQARVPVSTRVGTERDLPFIAKLQKAQSKKVGFLPKMALEGKVRLGQVLVAEVYGRPAGYLIAADRYFRRDEVGYVTQVNVETAYRRSLVAAALLQAQFDRSAYGRRLYCCWCAQDLKANEFWEAMGFSPIAFRTGSRTKGKGGTRRMHIFWQKRVRQGDMTTPWWYPSQTGGVELREDRLVFPIPPGVGWRDVLPVVLPAVEGEPAGEVEETPRSKWPRRRKVTKSRVVMKQRPHPPGGLWFEGDLVPTEETYEEWAWFDVTGAEVAAPKKIKPTPAPLDPRLAAMARELRDRWGERPGAVAELPAKHDVRRAVADESAAPAMTFEAAPRLTLPAAA